MQKFNLQQLPELSLEFLTQLRRLFKIFEIKSTGLAYYSQLENEMPRGVPGLPLRTLYVLNCLTKTKSGMFTFSDLIFCVRLLKSRNIDDNYLESILGKIKTNTELTVPTFKSSVKICNSKNIPKPPMRLSQMNFRSTNNLNIVEKPTCIPNQHRFMRSKSLQDVEVREHLINQKNPPKSLRNSQITLNKEVNDPTVRINQLINENYQLYKDIVAMKQELDYYRRMSMNFQKEPRVFPENLYSTKRNLKPHNPKHIITQF